MLTILLLSLLISLGVQLLFFTVAAAFKTDKVTDLSYSLTFILLVIISYFEGNAGTAGTLLTVMIVLWGVRLAVYLFTRILKIRKDKRFNGIRENFWSFAKFWLLQGVSVWVIMLPVIVFMNKPEIELSWLSYAGFALWLTGLLIETIADMQKFRFKLNPANKGRWIASGLWKYSRHPNYLGEIMVWWGVFIYALPALSGFEYLTVTGPVFITVLLMFITGIPVLEASADRKYGDKKAYQDYKQSTGLLLPKLN